MCDVYVRVEGPPEQLREFTAAVASDAQGAFDFNRVVAMPEQPQTDSDLSLAEAQRRLLWRCQNWGSGSNALRVSREGAEASGSVVYRFATAFAAPWVVLGELVDRFPHLSITGGYSDPEAFIAGEFHSASYGLHVDRRDTYGVGDNGQEADAASQPNGFPPRAVSGH